MLHYTITDIQAIDPVQYDWGAVKWVCNGEVAPSCEQSFGLVHILPGKTNPLHWHTAAEEIVYVLSGECDIKLAEQWQRLTPGLTLHIPPGVRHELTNNGWEPVIYSRVLLGLNAGHSVRRPHRRRRPADIIVVLMRNEREPERVRSGSGRA